MRPTQAALINASRPATLVPTLGIVRLSSLTQVAESGDGTAGWVYTRTGTGDFTTSYASGADKTFASSANGYVIMVYATGVPNGGLDTVSTANNCGSWQFGFYSSGIGNPYLYVQSGSFNNTTNGASVNAAAGDWLKFERSGTTVYVSVSKNSGNAWTLIHTFTGFSTAQLWPKLNFNAAASIGPIYQQGLT